MTIYKTIILILLSFVFCLANVYAGTSYGDIQSLINKQQYQEALELTETQLAENNLNMKLQFMQGLILMRLDRNSDAEKVFLKLNQENPELPETFNSLAVAYTAQGKYAEAEAAFKKAIEIYPNYLTAHENLGDVYAKMASQSYKRVLKLKSRDAVETRLIKQKLSYADGLTLSLTEPEAKPELAKTTCYTFAAIAQPNESLILSNWLDAKEILYKQRQADANGDSLVRVYLAPLDSRSLAETTMKALREQGVQDMMLITKGVLLHAISLGVYSKQRYADSRIKDIKLKGYEPIAATINSDNKTLSFDVRIVQNSKNESDVFTDLPARFNAIPVDCNEIAMQ